MKEVLKKFKKSYSKENESKETQQVEIQKKKKSYARCHGLFLGLLNTGFKKCALN